MQPKQVTLLYKNILSIIPQGVAILNSHNQLLYANPTLKRIFQSNQKSDILHILMNLGNQKRNNVDLNKQHFD